MARRAFPGTGWAVVVTAQAAALLLLAAPCHAQPTSVALTADGGKSVSIPTLCCSFAPVFVECMLCPPDRHRLFLTKLLPLCTQPRKHVGARS